MEYFVKPNGIGNGTSINHAGEFTNIVKSLKPNDILYVLPGVYTYKEQIDVHSNGEKEKEISIMAYDMCDLPIFDFRYQIYGSRTSSDGNGFRLFGEYLHIKGIKVAYAGYKGIRSELSHSILENIEVYGCCDSGIQMCSGGNNILINCISHDNFGYKRMDGNIVKFGYDSDGISDKLHYDLPNKFINCKSFNNTDDGFDFFGRCTENFTYIEGSDSYNNGISLFDMSDYPRYEVDKEWFDIFKTPKLYQTISGDTIISLTEYPAFGNGNGFKLGGKYRYHCIELHNCSAINNKMKGFDQNHNSGTMKLYNCTAKLNNTFDYGFRDEKVGITYFYDCMSENNNVSIKNKEFYINNCSWNIK